MQLVDQNSALKKEAGIAERKLLARNERIQNLETLLQDADRRLAIQNQKFETQLQSVKERLEQARGKGNVPIYLVGYLRSGIAQKASNTSTLSFGRIAKPLRGGGGSAAVAGITSGSTQATGGSGPSSTNPLTRIQNEEGG